MHEGMLTAGEHFRGYVVERLLGEGGFGAVYLVRHEMLDVLYAMKVMYPDVATRDPRYVKRFLREAKLAARIRHPNLISVHECGCDSEHGLYYLVMDYIPGGNLRDALSIGGKMTPQDAVRIVAQVASALQAAQVYKVVHRDIKPENIMLKADGSAKLSDLGIAKASNLDESLRTTNDLAFGTPEYVSPEQASNAANVDIRADIYSLGIVFFEMVTGRSPFNASTPVKIISMVMSDEPTPDPRDFDPSVPAPVAVLIRRMTIKDVNRRIASLEALLAELSKFGWDLGITSSAADIAPAVVDGASPPPLAMDINTLPVNNKSLTMDTDDPEVLKFIAALKRRRRRKNVVVVAAVTLAILAVCAIVAMALS